MVLRTKIAMYRVAKAPYKLTALCCGIPVPEWGCVRSNHRRIRRKPLASPGQPWERRPATRGFACRRISSVSES